MAKTLHDLIAFVPGVIEVRGDAVVTAPVVESDTEVEPGGVFVARRGLSVDGHSFIPRVIERGAAVIVGEREMSSVPVPYVQVENAQEATGYLAAAWHDFPSRRMRVIGVTGTDGKTTTSTLLHRMLNAASGGHAGLISTVAAQFGSQEVDTGFHVTTPSAPQVQALLAQMATNGMTYCVLEMTSHGLAQGRLNGVDIDVAVLTNLTHEHLDYHGTFENYRAAKARMFQMLSTSYRKPGQAKISIINADDASADFFGAIPADQVITYGLTDRADFQAVDVIYHPDGIRFNVLDRQTEQKQRDFFGPLLGEFNLLNSLAAIQTCRALGVDLNDCYAALAQFQGVPGRMERIDAGQPFAALVDFAHTPNSLRNALNAARKITTEEGQLIAVFGCAGLRDREKRRLMPEIAVGIANFCIFTAEDPRTESLDEILRVMAQAASGAGAVEGADFICVPDRGEALQRACQMARPGDVVIACGKGHEQSMCFGAIEYPWDDRAALRAALQGDPPRNLPTATRV